MRVQQPRSLWMFWERGETIKSEIRRAALIAIGIHLLLILFLNRYAVESKSPISSPTLSFVSIAEIPDPPEITLPRKTISSTSFAPPFPPMSRPPRVVTRAIDAPTFPLAPNTLENAEGILDGNPIGLDAMGGWDGNHSLLPPPPESLSLNRSDSLKWNPTKRCQPDERYQVLLANGGNVECEEATKKALKWLSLQQNEDGSWGNLYKIKMTSLALLAFLGRCETHTSSAYGEDIIKATLYLAESSLRNDGYLVSPDTNMLQQIFHGRLEHPIGLYALCESYIMFLQHGTPCPHISTLEKSIRQSLQFAYDRQAPMGGWFWDKVELSPKEIQDRARTHHQEWLACTSWHLQALWSAKQTGLIDSALDEKINKGLQSLLLIQEACRKHRVAFRPLQGKINPSSPASLGSASLLSVAKVFAYQPSSTMLGNDKSRTKNIAAKRGCRSNCNQGRRDCYGGPGL